VCIQTIRFLRNASGSEVEGGKVERKSVDVDSSQVIDDRLMFDRVVQSLDRVVRLYVERSASGCWVKDSRRSAVPAVLPVYISNSPFTDRFRYLRVRVELSELFSLLRRNQLLVNGPEEIFVELRN
jgi:hypothetical protein